MDMPQPGNVRIQPPRPGDASDQELVAQARGGAASAFREIMQRNNRRLFRVARSVLKVDSDAEDAVQDAYVRAFSSLDGYAGEAALSTWLTRIALNVALAQLRRRRTMIDLDDLVAGTAVAGDGHSSSRVIPFPMAQPEAGSPEHIAARTEIRRALERAIDGLPDPFRAPFLMCVIEQMTVEEAASCLGVPPNTVKTRVHRAKRRLRNALEKQLASALLDTFPFAGTRCARLSDTVLRRLGIEDPPPTAA
jgi:RNA polymerase sigma-70 factor (ECF subfamily)